MDDTVGSKIKRFYYQRLADECIFAASVCESIQRGDLMLDLDQTQRDHERIYDLCESLELEFGEEED